MKIIKNNIKSFIITIILLGGIAVVYAATIASSTVSYTNASNNSVATVEDALNDLYPKFFPIPVMECYNGVCGELSYRYWNNNFAGDSGANLFDSTHMPATTYATRSLLEQNDQRFSHNPIYIRSVLIDGNVVGHEACLWDNNREFCIGPNYWAGTIGVNDSTVGTNTRIKLQRDMLNALNWDIENINYDDNQIQAFIYNGPYLSCGARSNGTSYCYNDETLDDCNVTTDGSAYCYYSL